MHPITHAVRTHIAGLNDLAEATLSDLVRDLLQAFDDDGADGLDRVITATPHLAPDDLDRLFHLAMVAKHGARADEATVESLAFAALRETALAIAPGNDVHDAAPRPATGPSVRSTCHSE